VIATIDLSQRIRAILTERLHLEAPGQDADLFKDGVLDSLALVDLISELEREFGFCLPLEQLNFDDFRTLDRIVQFVERSQSAQRR
jgi:acyl carrier protein